MPLNPFNKGEKPPLEVSNLACTANYEPKFFDCEICGCAVREFAVKTVEVRKFDRHMNQESDPYQAARVVDELRYCRRDKPEYDYIDRFFDGEKRYKLIPAELKLIEEVPLASA